MTPVSNSRLNVKYLNYYVLNLILCISIAKRTTSIKIYFITDFLKVIFINCVDLSVLRKYYFLYEIAYFESEKLLNSRVPNNIFTSPTSRPQCLTAIINILCRECLPRAKVVHRLHPSLYFGSEVTGKAGRTPFTKRFIIKRFI